MGFSLYWGPFHPSLERAFLTELRKNRAKDPLAPLTVLVPNFQLVRYLRNLAARELGAHFNLRFDTLANAASRAVSRDQLQKGTRPLQEALRSWVLRGFAPKVLPPKSPLCGLMESPGLYRSLLAALDELRQGRFTPDLLESAAKKAPNATMASTAREWAAWMREYSSWKAQHGFHDREEALEAVLRTPGFLPGAVWVYGFYDANALQREVLLRMAGRQNDLWFVPYREQEAYAYARPFVEWAKKNASGSSSPTAEAGKGQHPPLLGRLADRLFERTEDPGDAPPPPGDPASSELKILLAPGGVGETEEAARLLVEELERHPGSRLSDSAALFRIPDPHRRDASDGFHNLGIPVENHLSSPLLSTPPGKAALLLLKTLGEEMARVPLMDLMACHALDPAGFGLKEEEWNPPGWDLLTKELKHTRGAGALLDRLKAAVRARKEDDGEEGRDARLSDAASLLKAVHRLADLNAKLAASRKWEGSLSLLADSLRDLLTSSREKDDLVEALEGLSEMEGTGGAFVPSNLPAVARSLWEGMMSAPAKVPEGGVKLLDLMGSRGLAFDVVVVPGMVAGSFPPGQRPDPMMPDPVREWLNDAGRASGAWIPLKAASRDEERLLFALAAAGARKALILTAPLNDPVSGDPRSPSPYLFDVLEAVSGEHHERLEESSLVRVVRMKDRLHRAPAECVSVLETLMTSMRQAREGRDRAAATALARRAPFALEGARLIRERQGRRTFTPYDGVFRDAHAVKALAGADGLSGVAVSASRIEMYATCPLRYFFRYVLHLDAVREPEDSVQADPLERGNVLHGILEETFRTGMKMGWWEPPPLERDEHAALAVLERVAAAAFDDFEKNGVTGAPALWQADRQRFTGDLKRVLLLALRDPDWVPLDVEKVFGRGADEPVLFPVGPDGMRLTGRIDRVDRSTRGRDLRIVDYKTGQAGADYADQKMKNGRKIQLALYLWASRVLYPGKSPVEGRYDFLTEDGGHEAVRYMLSNEEDRRTMEARLKQVLGTAAAGAARGLFPALARDCRTCDFKTLCGVEQEKRKDRKIGDERVKEILALEEVP